MKTISGDLITLAKNGVFDVIVHGCNCQNTMGAGIALSIKRNFPAAFEADMRTARGDRNKLGSYSCATVTLGVHELTIVNAYSQFHWRGAGPQVDYDAVANLFNRIKEDFCGRRIGYPKIGAGLAGGNWERLALIIDAALIGEDHTLVNYVP